MSDRHGLTVSPEWVSYCINPQCQQRQNPEMGKVCQSCGTPLFVCDRYRLISPLRPLNQPTSTELFEVEDWGDNAEACNPLKVLKVLKPTDNRALIRLFEQEARVLTALKHPQLPTVEPYSPFLVTLNSGTILRCLVQQKIDGVNLEQWITQHGPISHHQALEILRQLAEILKFVHSKGFFHRDIKPANIMRRPNGKLVLIDFGTAREVTASLVEKREQQTVTRVISEGYTAPEQRQGKGLPKSDLFALGRTMVYLLTGRSPLEFEDPETGELVGWQGGCPNLNPALASAINQLIHPISSQRTRNPERLLNQLDEIEIKPQNNLNSTLGNFFFIPKLSIFIQKINSLKGKSAIKYNPLKLNWGVLSVVVFILFYLNLPQLSFKTNNAASDYYQSGDFNKAKLYINLTLLLNSKLCEAHYIKGLISDAEQNFTVARRYYEMAMPCVPDKVNNNLGRLDILEGQPSSAITRLQKGLQLVKDLELKSILHKNMGWALVEIGEQKEAHSHLSEAIHLAPSRASAYCLLAQLLEAGGNSSYALGAWRSCIKNAPNDKHLPEVDQWIHQALLRLGPQAEDDLDQL
ncbi:protein kinase domain-containing protein [Laspinema olomoucense]|uniref:non-specific serine/threonine protein kinase n=1 Tax=Laspinema olomoucense D3b TaxID=2953688 RepID=A0ABT2NAE4_9CYAN|nr:serine/threonine-protein kinase [Laspinema sp. D3b]MCT7979673.1 serine/threonine-protein kinase [Laspinema sp. D3b]